MRDFIPEPSFNGVGAGQTASITLPVGALTYHALTLSYFTTVAGNGNQANFEAHVTEVRVKLNGKVQRRFSGKELDTINAYHNHPNQANGTSWDATIYFSEPWRRTVGGEDSLAWGMADVSTFQLEVDLAAAATGPTLICHAEVERVNRPLGPIVKWRRYQIPVAAVGVASINTLPKSDAYYAIHGFPVALADITDVTVKIDQVDRLKGLTADIRNSVVRYGWTPQANHLPLHFDRTARVGDGLSMLATPKLQVQDFRIDFNMANANTFSVQTLILGPRD